MLKLRWHLTCVLHAGLHVTYPRDKRRAMTLAINDPSCHPEVRASLSLSLLLSEEHGKHLPSVKAHQELCTSVRA